MSRLNTSRFASPRLAYVPVVLGVLLAVLFALSSSFMGGIVFGAASIFLSLTLLVGVLVYTPESPAPWLTAAGAPLLNALGLAFHLASPDRFSILATVLTSLSYLTLASALVLLLRAFTPVWSSGAALDGLTLSLSTGMLSWLIFSAPVFTEHSVPEDKAVTLTLFPALSVFGVALLILLTLAGAWQAKAFRFAGSGLTLSCAADLLRSASVAHIVSLPTGIVGGGYILGYGLIGAAALHPTMRDLTLRHPARTYRITSAHMAVLGTALGLPFFAALILNDRLSGPTPLILGLSALALGVVISLRVRQVVSTTTALQERLTEAALVDTLTTLANRNAVEEHLTALLDSYRSSDIAVSYLDLDGFKNVNDSWGHTAGDELLAAVATRLAEVASPGALVGRLGGDEFVIVETLTPGDTADDLGRLYSLALSAPVAITAGEVAIFSAVGVATIAPDEDATAESLIHDADLAMYTAKGTGPGQYQVFDAEMRELTQLRARMATEFRVAFANDELFLGFKPIVEVASGVPVALDAQVRFAHSELGICDRYTLGAWGIIGLSGIGPKLSRWALKTGMEQLMVWQRQFDAPDLALNILIPSYVFRDPEYPRFVAELLRTTGMKPSTVWLQVNEDAFMDDPQATWAICGELDALGVRLITDDFGTGYSSLGHVTDFPVSTVRLAARLVAGLGSDKRDEAVAGAVLGMARALSLEVIAEEVTTLAQKERAQQMGVQLMEGPIVAQCLSVSDAHTFLKRFAGSLGERSQARLTPTLRGLKTPTQKSYLDALNAPAAPNQKDARPILTVVGKNDAARKEAAKKANPNQPNVKAVYGATDQDPSTSFTQRPQNGRKKWGHLALVERGPKAPTKK